MSGSHKNQQKEGFQIADNSVLAEEQDNIGNLYERDCSNKYISRRNIGIFIIVVIAMLIVLLIILALDSFKRSRQQQQNKRQHFFYEEHIGDYKSFTLPFPSAGMRTPGVPFNFTEVQPGQDYYNFQKQLDQIMKPYNDTNCILERIGTMQSDGGYAYCKNLMDNTKALINLGIEGRDEFGCDIVKRHLIPNFQYDCSLNKRTPCQKYDYFNIYDNTCIAQISQDSFYQFQTLRSMIDSRGLFGKHIIIKSDVEGAQWLGFRTFPMFYIDNIDQIIMELHFPGKDQGHKLFWGDLQTIKSISQHFVSVNMHMTYYACQNPERIKNKEVFFPSFAVEVTLVNKKLIKLNSETRSYAIGSNRTINVINSGNWSDPDCQMHD